MDFNFTSQICTTKEQSERLLTLGLKKETADMCLDNMGNIYTFLKHFMNGNMKKILFCLVAILSMSCTCNNCNNDTHKPDETDVTPLNYAYYIEVIEIEGHLYIVYDEGYGGGICHAEHCPCRNNN